MSTCIYIRVMRDGAPMTSFCDRGMLERTVHALCRELKEWQDEHS